VTDKHKPRPHRISFKNSYFRGLRMMLPISCRLATAAVLLGFATAPVLASNQQGPPPRWWKNEAIVKDLGLTADQSTRIEAIFEVAFPELRQEREELEHLEAKFSRMIRDGQVDEATLARQIDRVETARASGNKTRSLMLMRMYRVLTHDQRLRFDELSKQWAASNSGRGGSKPGPSQGNRNSSGTPRPR
jgi:Spy/CpxP family protein refolding chaperone